MSLYMYLCYVRNKEIHYNREQKQSYLFYHKNKSEMRSFKSDENIHKKKDGSYYVVSANLALSVAL